LVHCIGLESDALASFATMLQLCMLTLL
jgi:hypothetical protein